MRRVVLPGRHSRGGEPSGETVPGATTLLVTGIPRSGTSYLCHLLHRFDNCVALNEPGELVRSLAREKRVLGLRAYVDRVREDILAGRPIANKLLNGKVVTDTMEADAQVLYLPAPRTEQFVIAVKNTASLLSRLADAREVLGEPLTVACVRNPFDTIASWIRTFPHLREADVRSLPVANPRHRWIPEGDRDSLRRIERTRSLPLRRALLWTHFAEIVDRSRQGVTILRYPDVVRRPRETLARIAPAGELGILMEPPLASEPRRRAGDLLPEDRAVITEICLPVAVRLGIAAPD